MVLVPFFPQRLKNHCNVPPTNHLYLMIVKCFDPDGSGLFYNSSVAYGECLLGGLMNMSQSIDLHQEEL